MVVLNTGGFAINPHLIQKGAYDDGKLFNIGQLPIGESNHGIARALQLSPAGTVGT